MGSERYQEYIVENKKNKIKFTYNTYPKFKITEIETSELIEKEEYDNKKVKQFIKEFNIMKKLEG